VPALGYVPQYSFVEVPEPENLCSCYAAVRRGVRRWLEEKRLGSDEVVVDITGGTKPMSAGLALAAVEQFRHFTYVGGREREKGGLGVVVSGTERTVPTLNPWDELAVKELGLAEEFYRQGQVRAAALILHRAAEKCREKRAELATLGKLCENMARADDFRFGRVYEDFRSIETALELILHGRRRWILTALRKLAEHWRLVASETRAASGGEAAAAPATVVELIANAGRRAAQKRYDDAVARLYRATELVVQNRLREAFRAKLGKLKLAGVPEARRGEFAERFSACLDDEGVYVLGLKRGFEALGFSPREDDHAFSLRHEELKDPLAFRNQSILAHGLVAISEQHYERLRARALELAGVAEEDIPAWPAIEFRGDD